MALLCEVNDNLLLPRSRVSRRRELETFGAVQYCSRGDFVRIVGRRGIESLPVEGMNVVPSYAFSGQQYPYILVPDARLPVHSVNHLVDCNMSLKHLRNKHEYGVDLELERCDSHRRQVQGSTNCNG